MNRIFLVLALSMAIAMAWSTELVIEKTDGSKIKIDLSEIRSLSFSEADLEETPVMAFKDLRAYWPLDGNALDLGSTGMHGRLIGTRPVVGINGKDGSALGFQGGYGDTGEHVILPYLDLAQYKQFTISLWVREIRMENSDGEAYIWFGDHFDGGLGIAHLYNDLVFFANDSSISLPFRDEYQNNWMHYALVQKDNAITAYVNGNAVGSNEHAVRLGSKNAGLGCHWWGQSSFSARFTGSIDEVRVFNRALSPKELMTMYQEVR